MRRVLRVGLSLLVGLALAAGIALLVAQSFYEGAGPLDEPRQVVIPRGSSTGAVAERLADAGVISDPRIFHAAAVATGKNRRLRAGEYAFDPGISLRGVLELLESGKTVIRRFTVPEGLTSTEIVALLDATEGLAGEIEEVPPEGAHLPETYHYSWGDDRAQLLRRMQSAMSETLERLWEERAEGLPVARPEEAVTLASIVEKETGIADERPLVASVFVNRLNRGMRLQSDPTVIYALTKGEEPLGRALTRADWQVEDPYNTYQIDGLPPGPIANPGRAAIAAVLDPLDSDYFYFVADGSGGHAFARTLDEHNRNVANWRRIRDGEGD
ncbi:endolytic transglycosylase MltG [Aquibaculum sediminis]|uniref:endolytic transglycosylase MltG n=1 Tax=Aquibaculum sediminis TaxID=3231907 RepID=UPI0034549419